MEQRDVEDIIRGFERGEIDHLRKIGGKLARRGALKSSHTLLEGGAIAYALAKVVQHRHRHTPDELENLKKAVLEELKLCIGATIEEMDTHFDKILDIITEFDKKTGKFISNLTEKARANKATTAYSSGLSVGKAAQLAGVSEWEILRYSGNTKLSEEIGITKHLHTRLKVARELLK